MSTAPGSGGDQAGRPEPADRVCRARLPVLRSLPNRRRLDRDVRRPGLVVRRDRLARLHPAAHLRPADPDRLRDDRPHHVALVTESTYLYFLQPIISDGLIAALFLLSLSTARPMVSRLAGDFYPMDHELSLRPRLRRLFSGLTLMWGALALGKAVFTLWLLRSQTLDTFVLIKSISLPTLNVLAVAATIGAAVVVAHKEGLLAPATHGPLPVGG